MASVDLYQTMKSTALAHMHAYESPHPWSFEHIWHYRTEDCVHYLYPNALLPPPFNEGLGKEGFKSAMQFFGSVMDGTRFEVHHVCVDTRKCTVLLHLTGHLDLTAIPGPEGVEAEKDWQAQYMWLCHMNDSGNKITRVDEFMDGQRLMLEVKSRAEKRMSSVSQQ